MLPSQPERSYLNLEWLLIPWEISDTSWAFIYIKVSFEGNGLRASVYYKPTDFLYFLALFCSVSLNLWQKT